MIEQQDQVELGRLMQLATARQATLATAESVTGGILATWFTELAGSSRIYLGGVCAYAEDVKIGLLGVAPALIATHSAVSREVVIAMAQGVLGLTGATHAVATTGFAGPEGGSASAPLGTVWCGLASARGVEAFQLKLQGERSFIRREAARALVRRLITTLEQNLL